MKKLFLAAAVLGFTAMSQVFAQDDTPKTNNKSEEIIIHNKGENDMNLTVQINGDSIMVNGKPLSQFIDSAVTIRKRKMIIHDGDKEMTFNLDNNNWFDNDAWKKQWDEAKRNYYHQLKKSRESSKPFLGVTTEKTDGGVRVVEVVPASAAEKAGIKQGDIITKINDKKIDNPEMLSATIVAMKPKDEIKVYYKREGKQKNSKAILGERKEEMTMAYSFEMPEMPEMPERPEAPEPPEMPEMGDLMNHNNFGMMPRQKKLGLKIQDTEDGMVKVIDVEDSSAAAKAGVLKDDIITEINGNKINNTDEARDQLHPEEGKNSYDIKVKRNGTEMSFTIKIPKKLKTADL
jgi:serine protease Do